MKREIQGVLHVQALHLHHYYTVCKYHKDQNHKKLHFSFSVNLHADPHTDVVTDCSYALAEFLVSTLFGAFPGQS